MATRSIWTGTLSFGLVSFGVKMYKATDDSSTETAMRMLHGTCLTPINEKKICQSCNTDVPYGDVVKGFEVAPNKYVVLTKEDLATIRPATADAIVVEAFVDASTIDPLYIETSYFLAPEKKQVDAFVLMQQSMTALGKVAQARMTIYGRERLVTIRPFDTGMVIQLMRTKSEVRTMRDIPTYITPGTVTARPEMVPLANQVVQMMSTGAPDYTDYEDGYVTAFLALVDAKQSGSGLPTTPQASVAPGVDLMAALKASLAGPQSAPKKTPKKVKVAKAA